MPLITSLRSVPSAKGNSNRQACPIRTLRSRDNIFQDYQVDFSKAATGV